MYRITGDSFTVFGDAVGDDAGNFEVVHADLAANSAMDHSIQMVMAVPMTITLEQSSRPKSLYNLTIVV
jgi:hypothetical protein